MKLKIKTHIYFLRLMTINVNIFRRIINNLNPDMYMKAKYYVYIPVTIQCVLYS